MTSQGLLKILGKFERERKRHEAATFKILHTLGIGEKRLVLSVMEGVASKRRRAVVTRRRRVPVVATAEKVGRKVVRRRKKAQRRPFAETVALLRAETVRPETATQIAKQLGYHSNSGIYGLLARVVRSGILKRIETPSGVTVYQAVTARASVVDATAAAVAEAEGVRDEVHA